MIAPVNESSYRAGATVALLAGAALVAALQRVCALARRTQVGAAGGRVPQRGPSSSR